MHTLALKSAANASVEPRWYRQFWPWVLIALPATAVVASLTTAYIAMKDPDGLVADDYYKEGLAINRSQARSGAAQALGLRGELRLSPEGGAAVLELGGGAAPLPELLKLQLLHATRAGLDVSMDVRRTDTTRYTLNLPVLAAGRWSVQVGTEEWRLDGVLDVPAATRVSLAPQTAAR